jgi:hypothetical protein
LEKPSRQAETRAAIRALVARDKSATTFDVEKKVAAAKKNPKRFTHLGFGRLLPQKSGFFAGRRLSGDGAPPSAAWRGGI